MCTIDHHKNREIPSGILFLVSVPLTASSFRVCLPPFFNQRLSKRFRILWDIFSLKCTSLKGWSSKRKLQWDICPLFYLSFHPFIQEACIRSLPCHIPMLVTWDAGVNKAEPLPCSLSGTCRPMKPRDSGQGLSLLDWQVQWGEGGS